MTRYRSPARPSEEWQQIIQEFDSSGLSPSEFCQLHDINIKTFTNNRYKQRKIVELSEPEPFIEVAKPDVEQHSDRKPHRPSPLPYLRLDAGDCQLHIPTSVTPVWIAELLREVVK
ncbi:IS66 family insertion sequence element accessory protein TnpA [Vibrio mediterranei]